MLTIDGSRGEGGGQILRTALALALCRGVPVRVERIRAGRERPGLLAQHLVCVRAAAEVGDAGVDGAEKGGATLAFVPRTPVRGGDYTFDVGSAGSAVLVLQTVLPPLLTAPRPTRLTLCGGTHNPFAPPFPFLRHAFLPLLRRMGPRVEAVLERPGFYPRGGGRFTVTVRPTARLAPLDLTRRGALRGVRATALVADLPRHIAERELAGIARILHLPPEALDVREAPGCGPGNAAWVEVEAEHVTEVFTAFGMPGVRAEAVGERAAQEARSYLEGGWPVAGHLADQLLLPLALAGAGAFVTGPLSRHARSNLEVIAAFGGPPLTVTDAPAGAVRVAVAGGAPHPSEGGERRGRTAGSLTDGANAL